MEEEERAAIPVWKRPDLRETRPVKDPVPLSPSMTFRLGRAPGRGGRFVTRSCFGGGNQAFVMAGGEDASLYIFHRKSGAQLCEIPGHQHDQHGELEPPIHMTSGPPLHRPICRKDLPPFLFPEPPKVLGEPPRYRAREGRMHRCPGLGRGAEEPAESEIKENRG